MTTAVRVPVGGAFLNGDLSKPARAQGLVVFAHGSGSSRLSPRNQYVARVLEGRTRHAADRSADAARGGDRRADQASAIRHSAAGGAPGRDSRVAKAPDGHRVAADWTVRGQHRRWRGADGRGRPARSHRSCRIARWTPGPRRHGLASCQGAHAAPRRGARRDGRGVESRRDVAHGGARLARRRAWRDTSVRRAGCARTRGRSRRNLVRSVPAAGAAASRAGLNFASCHAAGSSAAR